MTSHHGCVDQGVHYDPFDDRDSPFPTYRSLRGAAPVYHNPDRGFWALGRFDHMQRAARDWKGFSQVPGVDHDDTGKFRNLHAGSPP